MKLERPQSISRVLITVATLVYGVIPPFVDISETHAFHPDWPAHARFHMVWLLGTNSALAVVALYLMWLSKLELKIRMRLAGLIGLCVYGGFFISTLTRNLYGGALVDASGGVPPTMGMDANLAIFLPMLSLVLLGLWFANRSTQPDS